MTIRTLRSDAPLPQGAPRRYVTSGYVRLRWKVGKREYVETTEHRVIMGRPSGKHVHHKDHDRQNNDPANLEVLTPADHRREHREIDDVEVARRYLDGENLVEIAADTGFNHGALTRALARAGVEARHTPPNKQDVDGDRVLELHDLGLPATRIASAMETTPQVIRRILKERGAAPRKCGRPADTTPVSAPRPDSPILVPCNRCGAKAGKRCHQRSFAVEPGPEPYHRSRINRARAASAEAAHAIETVQP